MDFFYAYCRLVDDIADEGKAPVQQRTGVLNQIEGWLTTEGASPSHPFWNELRKIQKHFQIPNSTMAGILNAVRRDIRGSDEWIEMESWDQLDSYCKGVACDVGEGVLKILGAHGSEATSYAWNLGRCVQYLNILRDLESDFAENRIYVPKTYLQQHFITKANFLEKLPSIREELFTRAQSFRESAQAFSSACLVAELMSNMYLRAAKKYWRHGVQKRLSAFQKAKYALIDMIRFKLKTLA